jgi:HPt (histidine-containing phosphotransfer) domain-containing protein
MHEEAFESFCQEFFKENSPETIHKLLGFHNEHALVLSNHAPLLEKNMEYVIERFYGFVLNQKKSHSFFKDAEQISFLQNVNRRSFLGMFKGPFDKDYMKYRMMVGYVHYKINLDANLYVGGIRALHSALISLFKDLKLKEDNVTHQTIEEFFLLQEAIDSVIFLELYITLQTFFSLSQIKINNEKKLTVEILDNLSEGFCTITKNLKMGPISSKSCNNIFQNKIENLNLREALNCFDDRLANGMELLVQQTFDAFLPVDVNVSMLPSKVTRNDGAILKLLYNPILNSNEEPEKIILIAKDITQEELLLRETQKENFRNSCLISILQNKSGFCDFLEEFERDVLQLKNTPDPEIGKRMLHTLKGNSAAFGMVDLVSLIHSLEDQMSKSIVSPSYFAICSEKITVEMESFLESNYAVLNCQLGSSQERKLEISEKQITEILALLRPFQDDPSLHKIQSTLSDLKLRPISSLVGVLESTVKRVSAAVEKKIDFELIGGSYTVNAQNTLPVLKQFAHAIRNSCDHGIELPTDRLALGKPESGKISFMIQSSPQEDWVEFVMFDDGRGIHLDKLCQKALEKKIITQEKLQTMSEAEKCMLIFADNVSTAEQITQLSGRGVGLAALKWEVERAGGEICVENSPGNGMVLKVRLPQIFVKSPGDHHL